MVKLNELLKIFLKEEINMCVFDGEDLSPVYRKILYFPPGKIALIASRSKTERTLLMLALLTDIFNEKRSNHLYISTGESEEHIFSKLSTFLAYNSYKYSVQKASTDQGFATLKDLILQSENCRIQHHNSSWENLKKNLEEKIKEQKVDFLYIDNIQGIYSEIKFKNRAIELNYIMLELKKMSTKHQFSSIISSKISKNVDRRHYHIPQLFDLKGSESLEEIPDIIMLAYRLEKYGITRDLHGENVSGLLQIIIAKNRFGYNGSMELPFDNKIPCIKSTVSFMGSTFEIG